MGNASSAVHYAIDGVGLVFLVGLVAYALHLRSRRKATKRSLVASEAEAEAERLRKDLDVANTRLRRLRYQWLLATAAGRVPAPEQQDPPDHPLPRPASPPPARAGPRVNPAEAGAAAAGSLLRHFQRLAGDDVVDLQVLMDILHAGHGDDMV